MRGLKSTNEKYLTASIEDLQCMANEYDCPANHEEWTAFRQELGDIADALAERVLQIYEIIGRDAIELVRKPPEPRRRV